MTKDAVVDGDEWPWNTLPDRRTAAGFKPDELIEAELDKIDIVFARVFAGKAIEVLRANFAEPLAEEARRQFYTVVVLLIAKFRAFSQKMGDCVKATKHLDDGKELLAFVLKSRKGLREKFEETKSEEDKAACDAGVGAAATCLLQLRVLEL